MRAQETSQDKPFALVLGGLTDVNHPRLSEAFSLVIYDALDAPETWLHDNGHAVSHVLSDGHRGLPDEIGARLPNLKVVALNSVGYDGIDADAQAARDVIVTHTPTVLNEEVATTALLLLIACYRDFRANLSHAHTGAWATDGPAPLSRSVDNRTIGIIGLGRIGKTIARKLAPFSPTLLYTARSEKDVPFEFVPDLVELAARCDALINIAPGGDGTRKMINADVLRALGPDGVFVNVGRGTTVDEAAMIEALASGALGAAGLDVFEDEPRIPDALRALPNAVLVPHVGSATQETRAAMANLAADNLLDHLAAGTVRTPVPECDHLARLSPQANGATA